MDRCLAVSTGCLLAVLLAFGSIGWADEKTSPTEGPDPQGRPEKYKAGQSRRWVVWHDDHGWHVRTTTTKEKHRFNGSIQVEGGMFTTLNHLGQLEKKGKNTDLGTWNKERNLLRFDIKTHGKEDGFDFKVNGDAKSLVFTLQVDGADHPEEIFIGPKMQHPKEAKFTLPAHPGK